MRVTAPKFEAHRRAILDAASALFRSRGFEGVGVAEISKAAGLTHGAFYGHFASKSALTSAACSDTLSRAADMWRGQAAEARAAGGDGVAAIVTHYLTEHHRDTPSRGCGVALLATELSRAEPDLRDVLARGVEALATALEFEIALKRPDATQSQCSAASLAVLAAMVGGITLARALTDAGHSRAVLAAATTAALAAAEGNDMTHPLAGT